MTDLKIALARANQTIADMSITLAELGNDVRELKHVNGSDNAGCISQECKVTKRYQMHPLSVEIAKTVADIADIHTLILALIYMRLCWTLSIQISIKYLLFMFSTLARCRYSYRYSYSIS